MCSNLRLREMNLEKMRFVEVLVIYYVTLHFWVKQCLNISVFHNILIFYRAGIHVDGESLLRCVYPPRKITEWHQFPSKWRRRWSQWLLVTWSRCVRPSYSSAQHLAQMVQIPATLEDKELFWGKDCSVLCLAWWVTFPWVYSCDKLYIIFQSVSFC